MNLLIFEYIFTLSAGTAASSTSRVTIKKPRALSPPGRGTSSSKFLRDARTTIAFAYIRVLWYVYMCRRPELKRRSTYSMSKGLAQETQRWTWKTKNRFIPDTCSGTKPHAEDNWPYPSGSFFLQLASTASAWVRIGGSPKRCDTSQYGTARLRGSILEEGYWRWKDGNINSRFVEQPSVWYKEKLKETERYLHCVVLSLLPGVAHGHHTEGQVGQPQLPVFLQKLAAQQRHLDTDGVSTHGSINTVDCPWQFIVPTYLVNMKAQLVRVRKLWDSQGNIHPWLVVRWKFFLWTCAS